MVPHASGTLELVLRTPGDGGLAAAPLVPIDVELV